MRGLLPALDRLRHTKQLGYHKLRAGNHAAMVAVGYSPAMPGRATEREVVVDAAAECFAALGIAATTVEDIARGAGVSRATVYRYVGGKQKLIGEVVMREAVAVVEHLHQETAKVSSTDDILRVFVSEAVKVIQQRPVLSRAVGHDLVHTLPALTYDISMMPVLLEGLLSVLLPLRGTVLAPDGEDRLAVIAEEAIRFVIGRITTPTLDGRALDPVAAGERAAAVYGPALAQLAYST